MRGEMYVPPSTMTRGCGVIYVRSVLEPQPDLHQIAKVLVALAMEESKPPEHDDPHEADDRAA